MSKNVQIIPCKLKRQIKTENYWKLFILVILKDKRALFFMFNGQENSYFAPIITSICLKIFILAKNTVLMKKILSEKLINVLGRIIYFTINNVHLIKKSDTFIILLFHRLIRLNSVLFFSSYYNVSKAKIRALEDTKRKYI